MWHHNKREREWREEEIGSHARPSVNTRTYALDTIIVHWEGGGVFIINGEQI
jgi:hypothetical protein